MSLESQIAALVQASNNLTDAVSGKIGEIDNHLNQSTQEINRQLEQTKYMLPRIVITKNQSLAVPSGQSLPTGLSIHTEVACSVYQAIPSEPARRTAAHIALLQEIERDTSANLRVNEYYRKDFNIVKLSWAAVANPASGWLAFPNSVDSDTIPSVPLNTFLTVGALVKVLSGSITGAWGTGARLGKWTFCNEKLSPSGFGTYTHLHPMRNSQSGEILVAFPAAITGHIEKLENWFPNVNF
ncbi:hypothetical protein [Aeromonas dhakensis]|uniref:hypothetical protein n=1 Tax=Aeromonas dhakensis TaxID=196024 RepID=UPI003D1B2A81